MTRPFLTSLIVFVAVALVAIPIWSQQREPITKTGLVTALKDGGLSASRLTAQVKMRGVSFELLPAYEQEIRHAGRYLGKKGLDDLVAAVRDNYRAPVLSTVSNGEQRFFANVTPRELVEPYLTKNRLQADLAVAGYKGKWLRLDVEFRDILPVMFLERIPVAVRDSDNVSILLDFDHDRYANELAALQYGQRLSVTCVFERVVIVSVALSKCEINKGDSLPENNKAGQQPTPSATPSITQTMTNSPGGIQAGRDVIIGSSPQRTLTEEQCSSFLAITRSSAEKKALVVIESPLGDSEATKFAEEIDSLLKKAGWTTSVSQGAGYGKVPTGLIMQIHDKDNAPSGAALLQYALGQIGFKVEGAIGVNQYKSGDIRLIVGTRP